MIESEARNACKHCMLYRANIGRSPYSGVLEPCDGNPSQHAPAIVMTSHSGRCPDYAPMTTRQTTKL